MPICSSALKLESREEKLYDQIGESSLILEISFFGDHISIVVCMQFAEFCM